MLYYCITCRQIHEEVETEGWIFKTGFYTEKPDIPTIPLGICQKKQRENEEKAR